MTERDISGNEDRAYGAWVLAACGLLLGGCGEIKQPRLSVPDYERALKECMASLPVGPQQTTYSDWDEVVAECKHYAWNVGVLTALSTRAVRPGPSFPQSSPEAGGE